MTHTTYNELTALDRQIAERVFGLVRCQGKYHDAKFPNTQCYAQPDSPEQGAELPAYSASIEAAWQIVEKMTSNGEDGWEEWDFILYRDGDAALQWKARFEFPMMDGQGEHVYLLHEEEAEAATPALAVCRAALLAVASLPAPPAGEETTT